MVWCWWMSTYWLVSLCVCYAGFVVCDVSDGSVHLSLCMFFLAFICLVLRSLLQSKINVEKYFQLMVHAGAHSKLWNKPAVAVWKEQQTDWWGTMRKRMIQLPSRTGKAGWAHGGGGSIHSQRFFLICVGVGHHSFRILGSWSFTVTHTSTQIIPWSQSVNVAVRNLQGKESTKKKKNMRFGFLESRFPIRTHKKNILTDSYHFYCSRRNCRKRRV